MIVRIGDNIVSSLGFTTAENYRAVKAGRSGLQLYEDCLGVPEPFVASLIDKKQLDDHFSAICSSSNSYTALEKASILSVNRAAEEAQIDLASPRVLFFFSSTKGNIHLLEKSIHEGTALYLWHSAQLIAGYFKNPNTPVVISNACISGAAAQIAAMRELESGLYDYAVVVGADLLSKFIVSGFQSFKALAPEACRPFDVDRSGLNLGESAATIIFSSDEVYKTYKSYRSYKSYKFLKKGTIRNDANHISGPSRTGEGCFRSLQSVLQETTADEIAFINAHGTATPYNDRMESVALTRAGLESVPVNSLKGYFGHTLGAAGVLESIISMQALDDETVLATKGFSRGEDEYPLHITTQVTPTKKTHCLKMLSGFGGCNATLLFQKLTAG